MSTLYCLIYGDDPRHVFPVTVPEGNITIAEFRDILYTKTPTTFASTCVAADLIVYRLDEDNVSLSDPRLKSVGPDVTAQFNVTQCEDLFKLVWEVFDVERCWRGRPSVDVLVVGPTGMGEEVNSGNDDTYVEKNLFLLQSDGRIKTAVDGIVDAGLPVTVATSSSQISNTGMPPSSPSKRFQIIEASNTTPHDQNTFQKHKQRWIVGLTVLVMVAIALGVGIGFGLQKSSSSSSYGGNSASGSTGGPGSTGRPGGSSPPGSTNGISNGGGMSGVKKQGVEMFALLVGVVVGIVGSGLKL